MSLYGIDNTVDEAMILISQRIVTKGAKQHGNLSMKKTIPRVSSCKSGAAFSKASLKTKKKKEPRSSIEALLKRLHSGTNSN